VGARYALNGIILYGTGPLILLPQLRRMDGHARYPLHGMPCSDYSSSSLCHRHCCVSYVSGTGGFIYISWQSPWQATHHHEKIPFFFCTIVCLCWCLCSSVVSCALKLTTDYDAQYSQSLLVSVVFFLHNFSFMALPLLPKAGNNAT